MSAEELREKIIATVAKRGGHLASSLGAVELAMALVAEFDPSRDRIVWDVGHQAYAWKLLTGRADKFDTLRTLGGVAPFTNPAESPCDAAVAGHAGVALSVALGYAAARKLTGADYHAVAVTGDSSLVNGTCFEALNNCAAAGKVILILNDNGMSISKPTGSISRFLGRLIAGARYNRIKQAARRAGKAMRLYFLYGAVHRFKARVKSWFLADSFFEQFGFRYIGPVDGHDVKALRAALAVAKAEERSVIVHVVTKKGKGFAPAERNPTAWHGTGPFDPDKASSNIPASAAITWSRAAGEAIADAARKDERVVALTAAMGEGTGLESFAREFPTRFFDVGIAEEHMVAFAAGLAYAGLRPVVAVYSTFLQRAIDQVMHDVAIANLPVVFCVDRAGAVGQDGATHQGLYDIALLRAVPNMTICQPRDADDMRSLLDEALRRNGPTVIRYPRGGIPSSMSMPRSPSTACKLAIWSTGDWYAKALSVADAVGACAVHARYIKPIDRDLLDSQRKAGMKIVSIENASVVGGLGEAISADLRFGWPDKILAHGKTEELEHLHGLDEASIKERLTTWLRHTA